MSQKQKKKGVIKMDLGTFQSAAGNSLDDPMALPTGPDAFREPQERGPRGGSRYERNDARSGRNDFDNGPAPSDMVDSWSRGGARNGGGFGGGDRRGGGGYGGDRRGGFGGGGASERPAHLRNLLGGGDSGMPPRPPGRSVADAFGGGGGGGGGGFQPRFPNAQGASGGRFRNRFEGGVDDDAGFNDPRFANKFSGGSGGASSEPAEEFPDLAVTNEASAEAPVEQMSKMKLTPEEAAAKKKADTEAKRQRKAEDKQRRAEEAAAAQAAKEAEAAKKAEQEAADAAALAAMLAKASGALDSGRKGAALATHVRGMADDAAPSAAALLAEVLRREGEDESCSWADDDNYGAVLKALVGGNADRQAALVTESQRFCHSKAFPKVAQDKKLIALHFQALFLGEIVDNDGFDKWIESEDESVPGKSTALFQTTEFIALINQEEEEEEGEREEEEEEEEEIDAPMPTV